jgi:predicted RNA-binding protein YlxR (DUF448 family)
MFTFYVLRFTFYVLRFTFFIMKTQRQKHVPERTCIACRTTGAKRGLVRIVRNSDGTVQVDETGKKPGRGAYLCRTRDCWDAALKRKALEYALKTPISAQDKLALQAYAATLQVKREEDNEIVDSSQEMRSEV